MKRLILILAMVFILSGCATYKFQKGLKPPYDKGYVASYWGDVLPEYTVGQNNTVPDNLELAKERFNRRRLTVEKYYKDMGYIESRYKEVFWDPPVTIAHIVLGIFKLPFIAYSDYKYENDEKYREKIDKQEEDEYQKEKARITLLRAELNRYIQQDLSMESALPAPEKEAGVLSQVKTPEVAPAEVPKTETAVTEALKVEAPVVPEMKTQPETVFEKPVIENKAGEIEEYRKEEAGMQEVTPAPAQPAPTPVQKEKMPVPVISKQGVPAAVIIARPAKGFSPLKVNFSGAKSHSPNGRIVSYEWDFGDGDTSNKPKPVNTFWSTTYGTRIFTVSLTVKDSKGMTATATREIEVANK